MLHYRKHLGVRISSARKLGLEPLEDRSMPSVVTAALLSSTGPADNTSTSAAQTDAAQVADAADTASEPALLPLTQAEAETVSSATTANISKSLAISVDRVMLMMEENQAPVLIDFGALQIDDDDNWNFFGTVTDPDDELTSLTVSLGGVLASYNLTASVDSNGYFSVTCQCVGLEWGTATAQAQDPHGALSNIGECWVFPV